MKALINKKRLKERKNSVDTCVEKRRVANLEINHVQEYDMDQVEFLGEQSGKQFLQEEDKRFYVFQIKDNPQLSNLSSPTSKAYLVIECD